MKKRNLFERAIAFALALILAFSAGVGSVPVLAAETNDSGITLGLDWEEHPEFNNGTSYDLYEDEAVTNTVRMKVSYECSEIREEGYKAGELIIGVKGIGNVGRSGVVVATVGADPLSSAEKTRDWSYTWNKANDTYTFTNNEAIPGNSVFSGYFELVWEIKARDSVHGYTQSGMKAVMYMPDGSTLSSGTLSFSNQTKCDDFEVHIEQGVMYSYEGLTGNIPNPNDYAFVRYNLGASDYENSRGLQSYYYLFDPDVNGTGSGAVVISPALACEDMGDGTYKVQISSDPWIKMEEQYLFVAYPRSSYSEKITTASIAKFGAYYECDDAGNTDTAQLAVDTVDVNIPNDFDFTDIPGVIYQFYKDTYYDKHVLPSVTQAQGGDIPGRRMTTGTEQTFYLEGPLNNPDGENYTLEMVDDFFYIRKNSTQYRQLEPEEYTFTSVTIPGTSSLVNTNGVPIQSDVYPVSVYIATDGAILDPKTETPVWSGVITDSSQTVDLTAFSESISAIGIVMYDLAESIDYWVIPVNVKFHTKDTSGLEEQEQDNLTTGEVVNTTFIRVYAKSDAGTHSWNSHDGSYIWINDDFTEENYLDDTNLGLAEKDKQLYGNGVYYLDRERDNITFYDAPKNDYRAYTTISNIQAESNRFTSTVTLGADLSFKGDEYPTHYSIYTILDEGLSLSGYRMPEDIWDIMTLYSNSMTEMELAGACTPEVIEDYNGSGRTYIALHFDFGDDQVPQEDEVRAAFKVRVDPEYLKQSSTFRSRVAVIMDKDIAEYPLYKVADTGSWGGSELWADIDRDGDTEEMLTYAFDSVSYVYADSSQLQLTKYVQTTYSDGWVQLPEVPSEEFGQIYQYNLSLKNGKSQATNIIVRDILEVGANAQWQGTFQSVDLSKCAIPGTVYYSAKENPSADLTTSDWTETKPATTKAIAVDFGSSVLPEGQTLNILINMKAPEDVSLKDKITENGYSASFTMMDAATGNVTGSSELVSNFVQVTLAPALKSIVITKVDAESKANLKDAVFALYAIGADGNPTGDPVAEATSNAKGFAIFRNIPGDASYILREKSAPYGYDLAEDVRIDMNGTDQKLTVENPRKTGSIKVCKVNNLDNDVPVAGATYSLFDENGNIAKDALGNDVKDAVTNADGFALFEGLPWGTYIVKETATPSGYSLNETEYTVEITRNSVEQVQVVHTADVQDDVFIKLTKYESTVSGEKTEIPLAGVSFELMREAGETDENIGLYVTDVDGRIDIIELPYGTYYFKEYRTPAGYITAEDAVFTLDPDHKNIELAVYNQREPGSITVTKKDNLGDMLKDIEFTLYRKDEATGKPSETALTSGKTDEYGVVAFNDLDWGTYYIQETDAPAYYQMDTELKEVTIDAGSLEVNLEVINETVKGSVILTKTDENGITFLPGAEYTLYLSDGTVVGTYTTVAQETKIDEEITLMKGQFIAQNLEWGSYYFKETKAPDGYSLSDETLRFSVNAQNAGMVQYLDATDPLDAKTITLTKKILASDINFENGEPTFIFKVEGTDVSGNSHIYYRFVTFDETYVKSCIENQLDSEGYVSLSVSIGDLIAGTYTASEESTSRYYLAGISDAVNGVVEGDKVVFDLTGADTDVGSAVFTNRNYEQQDFSDAQILTNVLKQKRRLTALKVTYGATTAEAESAIDTDILEVIAMYDDGTVSDPLTKDEYVLTAEGEPVTNFPNQNGNYTITVSYSDNGITRTGNFTVTLSGMKIRIIKLDAALVGDSTVKVGTNITPDMFQVTAVYNNGTQKALANNEFTVNPTVAATGGEFDVTIALNLNQIPNDGYQVSTTVPMTAKYTAVLETGNEFNQHLPSTATAVIFTDNGAPSGVTTIDVSAEKNGSVVAWLDGTTFYVTARNAGEKILANADCSYMFKYKDLQEIRFNGNLDTSDTVDMTEMFDGVRVTELDVTSFDTSNVKSMMAMFENCYYLTTLDLSSFDTSNVERMNAMFQYTSLESITFGDKWTMKNVKAAGMMFGSCEMLKSLDVSKWDTSKLEFAHDMFAYCESLTELDVSNWNTSNIHDMESMFSGCKNLKELDLSNWDTSKVHSMNSMFEECESLTVLDLTSFDTRKVTNMGYMFYGCENLTTIYVTDNWYALPDKSSPMFSSCYSLVGGEGTTYTYSNSYADYAKIDGGVDDPGYLTGISMNYGLVGIGKTVTPVVKKQGVFQDYTVTGYSIVSGSEYATINAATGAVTGLAKGEVVVKMTAKNTAGRVITAEKTVYIGEIAYAVYSADDQSLTFLKSNEEIQKGQTYNSKTVTAVYPGIETAEYGVEMFTAESSAPWCVDGSNKKILRVIFEDTIKPINIAGWFGGFENITSIDLSMLDTSNVTSMAGLFVECEKLESITFGPNWTTSKVRDMNHMFYYCTSLTSLDVKGFDTSNVMDMSYMFARCTSLTELDLTGWDVSNVFNMSYMFLYCQGLTTLDMSKWNWDISSLENMEGMFQYCRGLTSITFDEDWNTPKLKNMYGTFYECEKMTQIDLGGIDTSNVEDASRLFIYCEALTELDLSGIDVSNMQAINGLFSGCINLVTVDISTWDTSKVSDMAGLFSRCTSLKTVYVSDTWSTAKVTSSSNMFYSCTNLVGGAGTVFDSNYVDKAYARIDGGTAAPGYFTDIADKSGT